MQDRKLTGQLLALLLENKSPELGARLKQRLIDEYNRRGLGVFNERTYGHSKFSEFLQEVYGDLLTLEKRDGSGDMLVSLRAARDAKYKAEHLNQRPAFQEDLTRISNDVWQAFANPDVNRKRFLNKANGLVRHFLTGEQNDAQKEVEASRDDFVEIDFVPGIEQQQWMKEYLETVDVPLEEKEALTSFTSGTYSSQVNKLFTRALGDRGKEWRQFRNKKMIKKMYQWAKENNIPLKFLRAPTRAVRQPVTTKLVGAGKMSPRQRASKLLELIDDDQIIKLVLPVLFAALLVDANS